MRRTSLPLLLSISLTLFGCTERDTTKAGTKPTFEAGKFDPNDPEFKKRVQARLEQQKQDEAILEKAPWFGTTGLTDEVERELRRYLRREFGQLLAQPNSIKASDLTYIGVFVEGAETVRYWRINFGSPEPKFAYVVSGPLDHQSTGWGNRAPPR